ncbi:abc superfamily atp binding cassette transporter, membrane protein [Paucilactobacillus vaccinostercus DSM 20634]|uniref:Abc superfamily atp binding cassette transporter, membrane protein n=1 Tax=Paucilactobacillus vaccinostercus DSM 20634 TaxID=1423813 RepID=A0A0R2A323_9LACO|nr:YfhO family protein [Paucilactobacillus vaccinostercus]KRM61376.1 abc superfamily atp binding cassette transporter, membrane protein [Paucilactobacillus vaccinostercus DSM 20634]
MNVKKRYYVISAVLPIIIFVIVLMGNSLFPFGDGTILHGDMNNQYLALFTYFRENLLDGNWQNLIYSNSMNIGSGFFGVLTYYLLNPFNLLVVFFSGANVPIFLELLTVAKVAIAGLFMFVWLSHSTIVNSEKGEYKYRVFAALICSSLYSTMSFLFFYKECIMWLDAIALLPLVILGVEKISIGKHVNLYVVIFFITIVLNYYMGVIVGIAACFAYVLFTLINWNKQKTIEHGTSLLKFIGSNILSVGLSAIVLIPSIISTAGIKQDHSFHFKVVYNPVYLLSEIFGGATGNNVPALSIGVIPVFLLILFFLYKKINVKTRILVFLFLVALLLSSWLDITYVIWHVFTWPNGYSQRESFVLVFFIVSIVYVSFKHVLNFGITLRQFMLSMIIICVLLSYPVLLTGFRKKYALIIVGAIVLFNGFAYLLKKTNFSVSIILLFIGSIILGNITLIDWQIQHEQVKSSIQLTAYKKYYKQVKYSVNKIKKSDKTMYRIGNSFQITNNDPLTFNYRGLSNYLSQQPNKLINFMSSLGYYQNHTFDRWTNYNNGATTSMDGFFSIKYILASDSIQLKKDILNVNNIMSGFTSDISKSYKKIDRFDTVEVYKNTSVFPLVNKVSSRKTCIFTKYDPMKNPFEIQNNFFDDLSGEKLSIFSIGKAEKISSEEFQYVVPRTGELYAYYPTEKNINYNPFDVYINGNKVASLYAGQGENGQSENGIISLGNFKKGTRLIISNRASKKVIPGYQNVNSVPFVTVENRTAYLTVREKVIKNTRIENLKMKSNLISFNTKGTFKKGDIMLTIPADSGWRAYVDGEKVTLKEKFGMLMAVHVSDGVHTVKIKYSIPGFFFGLLVSTVSLLVISVVLLLGHYKRRA